MKPATQFLTKSVAVLAMVVLALSSGVSLTFAQGGGGGGGDGNNGGGIDIPDIGGGIGNGDQLGGTNGGGTNNVGDAEGPTSIQDLLDGIQNQAEEIDIDNNRLQPFVGRSIIRYGEQTAGAHPRSNASSPGGGVTTGGGGGFGGGARGNQARGGQGLQAGNNVIIRKSLRTRLSSRIVLASPSSSRQVSSRFQQRLTRIPTTDLASQGVQVRVENKIAYLTGVVGSTQERNRVERMARLEPGIYKIQNQIQVRQ